jgi:uncharacterized protein YjiS (DUF1127 family)
MSSTKPVVRNVGQTVHVPALLDLACTLWRRLWPRSHTRMKRLATLSDHLLADVGLNRPGYEQPTWERYIHRQ